MAARIVSRLETPGLASGSKRISVSLSVTADLMRLVMTLGSSSRNTAPVGSDLLIFDVGSCRSRILAVSFAMSGFGTVKVGP